MTEPEQVETPERGSETSVMCLLHEFGAMDEEAIAHALDLRAETVTRCLGLLLARGLVRNIVFRGRISHESTGRWWPGIPSEEAPQERNERGRFAYEPPPELSPQRWNANGGPTMSPKEEADWVRSRQQ